LIVGLVLHDAVREDEAILVFGDRHAHTELDRDAGLAFADPLGVRLEDGEHLLMMRDAFAEQDAAANLVDLPLGMGDVVVQRGEHRLGQAAADVQLDAGQRARCRNCSASAKYSRQRCSICDARGALVRVLGRGAFELLQAPIGPLQAADVVGALAPVAQAFALAQPGTGLDDLARGIEQQVEVGGVVHVGLDHEGVAAHFQRRAGMRFDQGMPGLDHHLVDPIEHRGVNRRRLSLSVCTLQRSLPGPVADAEQLAHAAMFVGQLPDPVVVGIESPTQHAEHQHLPLRHAGAPGRDAHRPIAVLAHRQHLGEDGEHLLAQRVLGVDVLQTAQQPRDVVARSDIEFDRADVHFAELQLGVDDLAHG
jgi:hypothetical protein